MGLPEVGRSVKPVENQFERVAVPTLGGEKAVTVDLDRFSKCASGSPKRIHFLSFTIVLCFIYE